MCTYTHATMPERHACTYIPDGGYSFSSQTKVSHHSCELGATPPQQHVLGVEVSVKHAMCVQVVHAPGNVQGEAESTHP